MSIISYMSLKNHKTVGWYLKPFKNHKTVGWYLVLGFSISILLYVPGFVIIV